MFNFTIPFIIPITEIFLITCIYSLLRLHNCIGSVVSVGVCSLAIFSGIMLKMGIEVAVRVTETTVETQKLGKHSNSLNVMKRDDIQFFKSYRPFKWAVGSSSFTLKRDSFVRIIDAVVINAVISLLVTF